MGSRREDIKFIFDHYASGEERLQGSGLLQFLLRDQAEPGADDIMVERLIYMYEIDETDRQSKVMTFQGFLRYMESKDCCVLNCEHTDVYQDMSQPLCHYFISSSHNTYLTADQLVGKSHLFAYESALLKGCRCLEIDCWDGPDSEPIVYHGYTLTSKILFRDVIQTVAEHAFKASPYPVILSLENHCSPPQQKVMARYITTIFGDMLLDASLDLNSATELPSPEELQHKILIKNKKLSSRQDPTQALEKDRCMAETDEGNKRQGREEREEKESGFEEGEGEEDSEEEDYSEEDEDDLLLEESRSSTSEATKKKKEKVKVAVELSNLVIYTKSVKFVSFSHSSESQCYYENTSLAEKKARKLVAKSGVDFVIHNTKFISRIYPAGSRTLSSNYNPQEFWNVGCQLVALNFQTVGSSMDLNNGRFLDNGGCGYVLKPHFLRNREANFSPSSLPPNLQSVQVLMKVISGSNLPISKVGKPTAPYVRMEINGVPSDCCRMQCEPNKHNCLVDTIPEDQNLLDMVLLMIGGQDIVMALMAEGSSPWPSYAGPSEALNPKWDAPMNFTVSVPELALIRFTVRDHALRPANDFMGQYTLPFTSMKKGYRWVPLLSREGHDLDPASLFIFIWHS